MNVRERNRRVREYRRLVKSNEKNDNIISNDYVYKLGFDGLWNLFIEMSSKIINNITKEEFEKIIKGDKNIERLLKH